MVRLRQGLFWYYFEHNFEKALVDEEKGYPTDRIDADANGYLFRFSYFSNKINFDVFHALSDGTGAMNFLIGGGRLLFKAMRQTADVFDAYRNGRSPEKI